MSYTILEIRAADLTLSSHAGPAGSRRLQITAGAGYATLDPEQVVEMVAHTLLWLTGASESDPDWPTYLQIARHAVSRGRPNGSTVDPVSKSFTQASNSLLLDVLQKMRVARETYYRGQGIVALSDASPEIRAAFRALNVFDGLTTPEGK